MFNSIAGWTFFAYSLVSYFIHFNTYVSYNVTGDEYLRFICTLYTNQTFQITTRPSTPLAVTIC